MGEEKKILEEALRLDPGSRIYLTLAKLYLQEGSFEQARDVLEKGLQYFPDSLETLSLLSSTYKNLGQEDRAREVVGRIWEHLEKCGFFWDFLKSKDSSLIKVGSSLIFLGLQKKDLTLGEILEKGLEFLLEEGKACYEEEVSNLDFDQEILTSSLGEVLLSQGEYDKALDVYTKLLNEAKSEEEKSAFREKIEKIKSLQEQVSTSIEEVFSPEEEPVLSEETREVEEEKEVEPPSTPSLEKTEEVEAEEAPEEEGGEEDIVNLLEELATSLEERGSKA
ncbi:MAG: hypothetical protein PWR24_1398 [Desulfonauticus sp.]|nr:hypothetical protein [Desulfonauticus sp.]